MLTKIYNANNGTQFTNLFRRNDKPDPKMLSSGHLTNVLPAEPINGAPSLFEVQATEYCLTACLCQIHTRGNEYVTVIQQISGTASQLPKTIA